MKKISLLLTIFSVLLLLNSCKEKENEKPEENTTQINTDMTSNQQDMGQTMQVDPQQVTPTLAAPQGAPQQVTTQPGQKLNPPHGQPDHDCKIPVGAPLGSGSGNSNAKPAATQMQQMPVQPSNVVQGQQTPNKPVTAKPGEKLNPPHGQPGHDCKIPVGSPLK
jgi:flagellum-specific peptidoglycan hydrolase FlgJ